MTKLGVNPGAKLFQLKVTLRDIEPLIWRRVLTPGNTRLDMLHEVIQGAMGWENIHLHDFIIKGTVYGDPNDGSIPPKNFISERSTKAKLKFLNLEPGDTFTYRYDFGDDWELDVLVEEITDLLHDDFYPKCIGGERACPPEDCGGPPGYMDLLDRLTRPGSAEYKEAIEWLGGPFDPESFDIKQTIGRLPIMLTFS